jgi:hypothetical protein
MYDIKAKQRKRKAGLLEYMLEVRENVRRQSGARESLFTVQGYNLVFGSFGV